MVIGFFGRILRDEAGRAQVLLFINIALIVCGLCAGIFALLSMRRYGRKRILGRSIVGVIFNGLIIAALLNLFLPSLLSGTSRSNVVGKWTAKLATKPPSTVVVAFDEDGAFRYDASGANGQVATLSGTWVMTPTKTIGLTIEDVGQGDRTAIGQQLRFGIVQLIDEKQMVVKTDRGEEVYQRIP